jgi:hypothetical protein
MLSNCLRCVIVHIDIIQRLLRLDLGNLDPNAAFVTQNSPKDCGLCVFVSFKGFDGGGEFFGQGQDKKRHLLLVLMTLTKAQYFHAVVNFVPADSTEIQEKTCPQKSSLHASS